MVSKEIFLALTFVILVSADVIPLVPVSKQTFLRSSEIPAASTYSSSIFQDVFNDGHGLSYRTVQTHNPVLPLLEAKFIQPVISYHNAGSYNLPIPNIGLFIQNPSVVGDFAPVQQIETQTNPAASVVLQTEQVAASSTSNNNDDSVVIESN